MKYNNFKIREDGSRYEIPKYRIIKGEGLSEIPKYLLVQKDNHGRVTVLRESNIEEPLVDELEFLQEVTSNLSLSVIINPEYYDNTVTVQFVRGSKYDINDEEFISIVNKLNILAEALCLSSFNLESMAWMESPAGKESSPSMAALVQTYEDYEEKILTYLNPHKGRSGITHEQLLGMMIHDLKLKNEEVPSKETSMVITNLEQALHWQVFRQLDRENRNIVSTYSK